MLTLSLRDRDRLSVLRQIEQGRLSTSAAARQVGLSARQMRRLLRRFRQGGDGAVVHRARGRPSNHQLPAALKARVLARATEPQYHDFGPTLLAEHLARDPTIGPLHPATLRQWLLAAGRWTARPRRLRHRRRRERRAAWGELVQMDTSIHRWLEGRSPEPIVLIALLDDATSRLFARFVPRDTGAANRQLLVDYLTRFGRMGALYTDRASHFEPHFSQKARALAEAPAAQSLIQHALAGLDIELILARSPQAKGRVERLFQTLQDRLLKELRVAGVATLPAANQFLTRVFTPDWNRRFTVAPREPHDAHRPLPADRDLQVAFAETLERRVNPDFTIRYRNQHLQIPKAQAAATMPGTVLTIERRLDGSTHYRWRERYLKLTIPPVLRPAPAAPAPRRAVPRARPAADHPWRRTNGQFYSTQP